MYSLFFSARKFWTISLRLSYGHDVQKEQEQINVRDSAVDERMTIKCCQNASVHLIRISKHRGNSCHRKEFDDGGSYTCPCLNLYFDFNALVSSICWLSTLCLIYITVSN